MTDIIWFPSDIRLTFGYPLTRTRVIGVAGGYGAAHRDCLPASMLASNQ